MLVNKIAQSGLIVLDLEDFYASEGIEELDISKFLFKGLILKEKDFREALAQFDWEVYQGKNVALWCSTDAIVPQWAYMLLTAYLQGICAHLEFGSPATVGELLLINRLNEINIEDYRDERVIIKGCGKLEKSGKAYIEITKKLLPVVKSLMFGEPCSTVPVFKKK